MTAGDKAKKMLLVDEGLRLKPYRCTAGRLTVGYGHNLDDLGISQAVADLMLQEDLQIAEKACRRIFPGLFDQWGENRRLGWVNLAFNLGYNRLMQFRNTLRAARIEDWAEVEKGLRASLWFQQVGKRAERVIGMVCHETFPYD
jgi:lysozyme